MKCGFDMYDTYMSFYHVSVCECGFVCGSDTSLSCNPKVKYISSYSYVKGYALGLGVGSE